LVASFATTNETLQLVGTDVPGVTDLEPAQLTSGEEPEDRVPRRPEYLRGLIRSKRQPFCDCHGAVSLVPILLAVLIGRCESNSIRPQEIDTGLGRKQTDILRKLRKVDGRALAKIRELAGQEWAPAEIRRELESLGCSPVPTLPTIRDIVRENTPNDPSAPWTLGNSGSGEARLVLDVISYVLYATKGRIDHVTVRQAEWITRIRQAAPGLPNPEVWRLALDYMLREDAEEDTRDLDAILAFTPPADASPEVALRLAEQLGRLFGHLWPERDRSLPVQGQRRIERIGFLKGFVQATAHPYALSAAQVELESLSKEADG